MPLFITYLLIGFRNKTGDAAVSIQKLLKLLVTDDKPLSLSQGLLSCIFAINQQTLEYLNKGSTDKEGECIYGDKDTHKTYCTHSHTTHFSILTFQRTGLTEVIFSVMSSSTLKVLMTELILNATLYCWHQLRIL